MLEAMVDGHAAPFTAGAQARARAQTFLVTTDDDRAVVADERLVGGCAKRCSSMRQSTAPRGTDLERGSARGSSQHRRAPTTRRRPRRRLLSRARLLGGPRLERRRMPVKGARATSYASSRGAAAPSGLPDAAPRVRAVAQTGIAATALSADRRRRQQAESAGIGDGRRRRDGDRRPAAGARPRPGPQRYVGRRSAAEHGGGCGARGGVESSSAAAVPRRDGSFRSGRPCLGAAAVEAARRRRRPARQSA